jgi:hypothetical protein
MSVQHICRVCVLVIITAYGIDNMKAMEWNVFDSASVLDSPYLVSHSVQTDRRPIPHTKQRVAVVSPGE